ncbi:MAG: GldG family protein [Candidatus Binatia bacterium]
MARLGSFYGVVGFILLLFAGVAYFITRVFSTYVVVHLLLGSLAVIVYLSSSQGSIKTFLGERSTKYGISAAFYSLVFFAVLVAVNYLSARHHHRFDLTQSGVFSIAPQTQNVLQKLDKPLEIQAFVEAGSDPVLRDLLESYRYVSDKVKFRLIDPDKQPDLAEKFGISAVPSLHLQYGDRTNVVTRISEEEITNGIIKVTKAERKVVYFLSGHGEPDVTDVQAPRGYGQLKTALDNESYEVKPLVLSADAAIPDETDVLVVAGAERSLLDHEVTAIDTYLKKGKHALFLLNPRVTPELASYLQKWGVKVGDDVVVDEQIQLLKGRTFTLTPFVTTYGAHPITEDFSHRTALTAYGMTRSVEPHADGIPGVTPVSLAQTGPNAWAETDLENLFQHQTVRLDETDRKGPISLAVAVTANLKDMEAGQEGTSRLVVFGDAVFADNQHIQQYFNRDMVLNAINWLVGEEGLVTIRPRTLQASRVQLTQEQGTVIFYLSVLILPELLLIAGLAVWWRRSS